MLNKLIAWYIETNPTLHDLENEIEYAKINISIYDFIREVEKWKL